MNINIYASMMYFAPEERSGFKGMMDLRAIGSLLSWRICSETEDGARLDLAQICKAEAIYPRQMSFNASVTAHEHNGVRIVIFTPRGKDLEAVRGLDSLKELVKPRHSLHKGGLKTILMEIFRIGKVFNILAPIDEPELRLVFDKALIPPD